jgi:eukaryotic-like serine/threonine-protein kinase
VTPATDLGVLAAGDRVAGDYEVVGLLHRSRALDVYDVRGVGRDRRRVAKVVRPDRAGEEPVRRALLAEGRLLLSLSHENVVRAHEVIEGPDVVVILEMLRGETLRRALAAASAGLPVRDVAVLGTHVCSALGYLHDRGIVHLDLKPSNVVIDGGVAKLIDFSIARAPGPLRKRAGTRRYMSPEQARGGEVGPPADVWGAGMVLYQAATGRHVFEARGDGYPQLARRPEPVARLRSRLPRRLARAIDAALDPDPAARPTVGELAGALARSR